MLNEKGPLTEPLALPFSTFSNSLVTLPILLVVDGP